MITTNTYLHFQGNCEEAFKAYGKILGGTIGMTMRFSDAPAGMSSDPAFANVTGGYYSVTDGRPLVPVTPGADPQAQQALWQATAKQIAAFCGDEVVQRRSGA